MVFQWTAQDYLYVTAECVTGVLSVVGNALVLLAIAKTRSLQTVTNCFIGSLAAADLLVGILLPPSVIFPYLGEPRNFYGCVLINTVVVLITNVSILSMLAVALERFMAIRDPYRYQRLMSIKRAMITVALTWIIAIVVGLIPTMGWNSGEEEDFVTCSFVKVIDLKYMVYLVFFTVTLLPLFFMLIIYLYIFHIIRKQQRAVAQLMCITKSEKQTVRKYKREVRGAKGLAYVIALFAMCWMPIHIMNSVTVFAPEKAASLQWHLVAIVLSHANSFVNPFLYAFSNSKFKKAMVKLLFCGRCQQCFPEVYEEESQFPTGAQTPAAKRWSSCNTSSALPSSATQLQNFVEPCLSSRSSVGILNQAFAPDELGPLPEEGGESAVCSEAQNEGTASETASRVTETSSGKKSCRFENLDGAQVSQGQVDKPQLDGAKDRGSTPPVGNGPNTPIWVTLSAMTPHGQNEVVPISENAQCRTLSQEGHLGDHRPPRNSCSNNRNAVHPEEGGGVKVDIKDSEDGSRRFLSVRL